MASVDQGTPPDPAAHTVRGKLLAVLGCLVLGGSSVAVYELAWPFALAYSSWLAGVMFYAGLTSIGFLIGIALLVSAHACRASSRPARLKLWAKLLIVFGMGLNVSFPLMAYGTLLLRAMVGNEPIGSYEYPSVFDSSLLVLAVEDTVLPIALGFVVMAVAVIGGRRQPQLNVPVVFD
jgi:hypothetical protein